MLTPLFGVGGQEVRSGAGETNNANSSVLLAGCGGRGLEGGHRPRLGAGSGRCPRSSAELSPEHSLQAKGVSCSRGRRGIGFSSHHGSGVMELKVGVGKDMWLEGPPLWQKGLQRVLGHLASVLKAEKGF